MGRNVRAIWAGVGVSVLSVGLFAAAAHAAGTAPANGVYIGENVIVSWTPPPPGGPFPGLYQRPASPQPSRVDFECHAGACTTTIDGVGTVDVTETSDGHYRGTAAAPAGANCSFTSPAALIDVDVVASGNTLVQRTSTKAGRFPAHCTTGSADNGFKNGVVAKFTGTLSGSSTSEGAASSSVPGRSGTGELYRGKEHRESHVPAPDGKGTKADRLSTSVFLTCAAAGNDCSIGVNGLGDVALTRLSRSHYHGHGLRLIFPGCTPDSPPYGEVDLRISGRSLTMRVVTTAGTVTYNCVGNTTTDTFDGAVDVFTGTLEAAPAGTSSGVGSGASNGRSGTSAGITDLSANQVASRVAVAAGRRSSVPASLSTPSEAFSSASHVTQNVVLAALLVLLLVFPSQLFNSTFDKHHDRIEAALRKRTGRAAHPKRVTSPARRAGIYAGVAAIGALLSVFLDPHWKVNAASIALFVGVLATIIFGAAVSGFTNRQYRKARHLSIDATLQAVPSGLAIALACVIISRSVHFLPGYLYGLVGGFTFAVALARREDGQAHFAAFLVGLCVAIIGWLVFIPVGHAANHPHPGFLVLVADSFVAAVFIGGIEGALFNLVPLRFLPGHPVAQWSWSAWVATAAITTFLFVDVLLRPESGYLGQSTTASAVVTYGLFGLFGVASIAFWGYFRARPDPAPPKSHPTLAETLSTE